MDAIVLYPEIGTRDDVSSSSGSIHAKLSQIIYDIDEIILTKKKGVVATSNTVRAEANTERSTNVTAPIKYKDIKVWVEGTVRVTFDLRANGTTPAGYGAVYKNGSEVKVFTATTSNTTCTTEMSVKEGDNIQLYGYVGSGSSRTVYLKDFKVKFDYITELAVVSMD